MSAVTRWIKTGNVHDFVFLGKEVIATASGNHVLFYNLVRNEERIEYFNSATRGKGACCLAGHSIIPIFATVERRCNPKIVVHTYPEIRKIAECRHIGGPNFYLSCCFLGTEFLLSLTSFPSFQLIIWLWRSGEKVASIDTIFTDEIQTIEASLNSPNLVYQFSRVSGKLITYEIYGYSKKVSIVKNIIKPTSQKISCVCWTSNNNLLLCDIFRNVYIVNSDGKKIQLVLRGYSNIETQYRNIVFPFYNGFILTTDNASLTYYNKSLADNNLNECWNLAWTIKCTSYPVKLTQARHKEAILLQCEEGKIFNIRLSQENKPEMEEIFNHCRPFKLMVSLKPAETHAVVFDNSNYLSLINITNGSISSSLKINEEVLCVLSHPLVPLVAVSTSSGKLFCLVVSGDNINIIRTIFLHRVPFDKIKFSINGTMLAIASTISTDIFLLKTVIDKEIKVMFHIEFSKSIADFLIYERGTSLQLLMLTNSSTIKNVGNCIDVFSVKEADNSTAKMYEILLPNYYQHLNYGMGDVCDFLSSPYLSKQLHFFKFEKNYNSIELFNVIPTSHTLRKFDVHISENYLTTSGFDGNVILRKHSDLSKIIINFMSHPYQESGIKSSVISHDGTALVTLGKNGSLIGLNLLSGGIEIINKERKNIERVIWNGTENDNFPQSDGQTWLEQQELLMREREMKKLLAVKHSILVELKKLKFKISELLDANEPKSSESQLPISTFDLHVERRKEKLRSALKSREEKKLVLKERLDEKEGIISYLMQNFWDSLEVHDSTLLSFNGKNQIKNFSLRRIDKPEKMDDFSIELFDIPLSNIPTELNIDFEAISLDNNVPRKFSENYIYLKNDNEIVFTGSASFKWIKNDLPPNQLLKITLDPNQHDVIDCRENKLRIYFNRKFDEMKCLKSKLLQEIEDCQVKLNKYKSELKHVYGIISIESDFANFKWQSIEIPEYVITVKEEEVIPELPPDVRSSYEMDSTVSVNVTGTEEVFIYDPSFRDAQLKQMMDGLLEIRWEDEIRKNIPKPDCMLYKRPSKYNLKDKEAINIYREKVVILELERQKYNSFLESEISNINEKIKTKIENFDKKMEEFALEKINIQSSILQEILLRLNDEKNKISKEEGSKKIFQLVNNELSLLESENKSLISEVSSIEPVVAELRSRYEGLSKRDKLLEAKFRGEFAELKQPIVEHLLRQYKRRPRIGQIACASPVCLIEASRCLTAGRKSAILPREYLDFLRGMDSLDVMPSSLPPQIDANHWQTLCRLRRNKVEMEIKLRIAALELAEAEQTLFIVQKLSSTMQSKIYFTRNCIEEETLKQSRALNNPDIQLVLKAAQIEILTTGHSSDFENATIVNYRQLVGVNNELLSEGEQKIKAMSALTKLNKSTNFRHWKYQCLCMKLRHFKEHLVVLQKTKIGKEMQNYLVERSEGRIHHRGATSCGKMLKSVQKKFQRMLIEEKTGLLRVIAEIKYWRRRNAKLMKRIEVSAANKLETDELLEGDKLLRRNRSFRKNYMQSITERTSLVEKVKESREELTRLQTQLEILRLKTYPTLRFKDVSYHRRSVYSRKT